MSKVIDHILFAVGYIVVALLVAAVCSFIPVLNIIIWLGVGVIILFYPFLHCYLYDDFMSKQKEKEQKELVKKYKFQKDLEKAEKFFG